MDATVQPFQRATLAAEIQGRGIGRETQAGLVLKIGDLIRANTRSASAVVAEDRALDDTTAMRRQFDIGARRDVGTVLELPTRTRVGELAALRDEFIPHFAVIRGVNILLGGEAESTQETPILITTLTTLGGVLPTAYGIGGYNSIISPMSVAIG